MCEGGCAGPATATRTTLRCPPARHTFVRAPSSIIAAAMISAFPSWPSPTGTYAATVVIQRSGCTFPELSDFVWA